MHKYEFANIIECEGKTDEEIQNIIGGIRNLIAEHKGRIVKEDVWGKKELSYPIKKQNYGYYMFTTMMMEPQQLNQLEKKMHILSGSLRYLIINLDKEPGYNLHQEKDAAADKSESESVEEATPSESDEPEAAAEEQATEPTESKKSEPETISEPEVETAAEPKVEKADKKAVADKPVAKTPKTKKPAVKKTPAKEKSTEETKADKSKELDKILEDIL